MSNYQLHQVIEKLIAEKAKQHINGAALDFNGVERTTMRYVHDVGVIEGLKTALQISDDIEAGREAA